ncbi:hypothetical protein EJA71_27350 [Pseudomonas sp. PB106]|nr:hypothetical protein EJA71_27350 [Pseudomonas sp. PB106]
MWLTGVFWALGASSASAAIQEITAVFRPDPGNPMVNKFTNTTPQSGVCPGHIPARCEALGIFSIRTWDLTFKSSGPIPVNHVGPGQGDSRQGVMFKVPSEWRRFEVVSVRGDRQVVEMRIAGIGNRADVTPPAHAMQSWGPRTWSYPPAPCESIHVTGNSNLVLWFWMIPENAGACALAPLIEIPTLDYRMTEYAYELRTPNPLGMSTGQYRGSMTYTVGPNMDFDFGDLMIPNDNQLTFNFTLDVEHTLKVEVPPGGNRIELLPEGGWQAWLQRNRRPERLFRDQTFNLSASSRFRMGLECEHTDGGENCSIYEPSSGHAVPLNISVTLPAGLSDDSGQPVNRRRLVRGGGVEIFSPGYYVDRKAGILHFEVGSKDVEEMLTGVSKTYRANVTVIWDSEV